MEYITRFVEKDFKEWKDQYNRFALEVTGCRQVGKTTTVLHFANENYTTVISVNVGADKYLYLLEDVDEYNVVDRLTEYCEYRNIDFRNDRSTVLILDEIQENKLIYDRIRIFNRCLKCDVIITGSYLQKIKNEFVPVGDVFIVEMFPLSYEEYLEYFGLYELYRTCTIEQLCKKYLKEFKTVYDLYLHVGGYPSVFISYLEKTSINKIFKDLVSLICVEFRNSANRGADFDKISQMFRASCVVLCNEKKGNKKIVESISKLTEQEDSKRLSTKECNNLLGWMAATHLIRYCDKYDMQTKNLYEAERFYYEDVGLFNYLCDLYGFRQATIDGMLAETFVHKQLAENRYFEKFYGKHPAFAVDADYELDFYVKSRLDNKRYGIEVKSRKGQGISIDKMLSTGKIDYAIYAKGDSSAGCNGRKYTIPIFFINKFLFDKGGKAENSYRLPDIKKDEFKDMKAF